MTNCSPTWVLHSQWTWCCWACILRRLVERGIGNAALGPLWDPVAVRIGGKVSPMSGEPIDLVCTVKALQADLTMTGLGGVPVSLGPCALVEAAGIDVLLNSVRSQAIDTDMFTQLGCDLRGKQIVVVKSTQHFYASYAQLARRVIYVTAPGSVTQDLKSLPFRKIKRPKWPL